MKFDVSFYTEIFDKEAYWETLSDEGLLNIYYINGPDGLKDFYIKKLDILKSVSNKENIKFIINMINDILTEIDNLTTIYNSGKEIDIKELTNLFIINQITNKKSN